MKQRLNQKTAINLYGLCCFICGMMVVMTILALTSCHPTEETQTVAFPEAAAISIDIPPAPVAVATETAVRGTSAPVDTPSPAETTTETPPTTVGVPTAGDCFSWMKEFARRGATEGELAFFFTGSTDNKGIIWRETRCGTNMVNPNTSDRGICQINGVHAQAGYFGGRYFGQGGWLLGIAGIRHPARLDGGTDPASPQWIDGCLAMYRVCGQSPWKAGDYGCAGRRLEDVGY